MHVAVVGGGVTGLTAALRVVRRAAGAEVTLFEKNAYLGGEIFTERVDGFVIEAGADSFLSRKPRGVALCEELGVAGRLVARRAEHAGTFVRHRGALHPLPEGFTGMIPTRIDSLAESTLLSPEGRAAIANERTVPAPSEPGEESIAEFVTRRFGREVYERIVEPLMAGIYGGDGERLSLDATFPQLRGFERRYGSVVRGLVASREEVAIEDTPPFVSFASGMGEMIEHMALHTGGASIRTGAEVTAVEPRARGGFTIGLDDGANVGADAVILAAAHATARLVQPLDRELSELHTLIAYASAVTVSLAFRERDLPRPLDGYGYVVPRVEGSDVVACTIASNKWPGRAPEGHALLRVYLRAHDGRDITREGDDALVRAARRELESTYGITAPPALVRVGRWPAALPQYTRGHGARVERIRDRLRRHPGLFVAGAAYTGVGIPDCVASGEAAADAAVGIAASAAARAANH
ncbi:MAG: protoporphyrinogen oxidase [Acidobacteriota bacterium]